ncbi:MAG: DNA gyrase inhibitor YacG [Hyphomonadaceae bacterium]
MTDPVEKRKCVVCGKPQAEEYKPFCSKRCADVDLNRWFSGKYAIPAVEDEPSSDEGKS